MMVKSLIEAWILIVFGVKVRATNWVRGRREEVGVVIIEDRDKRK